MIPILLLDLAGIVLVAGYILLDRRTNSEAGSPLPVQEHPPTCPPPRSQMPTMPAISPEPMIARKRNSDRGRPGPESGRTGRPSAPSSSPEI